MTDITQVEISRRNFIKGMLGLAAAMGIPNLPVIDELPPTMPVEDAPLSKDEILEWVVDDSAEETITIKQSDNYIGAIRIDDKTYPLLSVDIAWRREGATLMGYEYPPEEISFDFITDAAVLADLNPEIADIELSVTGAQLAMKGEGYFTRKEGWQRFGDFYLWSCEVQLVGKPEFVI